jgi:hypothetical protein
MVVPAALVAQARPGNGFAVPNLGLGIVSFVDVRPTICWSILLLPRCSGGLRRELQNSKNRLLARGSEWRLSVCKSLPSRDREGAVDQPNIATLSKGWLAVPLALILLFCLGTLPLTIGAVCPDSRVVPFLYRQTEGPAVDWQESCRVVAGLQPAPATPPHDVSDRCDKSSRASSRTLRCAPP